MKEGISILIAAYNADKYIKECINSITTTTPHEILVGVDGCRKTLNVANKLKNENLKVFNKEKNTGAYDTWNMLIPKASFNHILIFAADDIMIEGYLDSVIDDLGCFDFMQLRCKTFHEDAHKETHEWVVDGTIIIRTDVMLDVNGYQKWRCSADTELKFRLKHFGYLGKASKRIGFRYRRHGDSLTMSESTDINNSLRLNYISQIQKMLDDKLFKNPI